MKSSLLVAALAVAGCAPIENQRAWERGPANPRGEEAPAPPPSSLNQPDPALRLAPIEETQPPSRGSSDGGVATSWTCPMHPEVKSASPGRCPRCGMTLVPKVTP